MQIDRKTMDALSSDTRINILKSLAKRRKTITELSNNKFAIDYYNFIKDREESIIFFSNAIKHAPSSQPYGHSCEIPTI